MHEASESCEKSVAARQRVTNWVSWGDPLATAIDALKWLSLVVASLGRAPATIKLWGHNSSKGKLSFSQTSKMDKKDQMWPF